MSHRNTRQSRKVANHLTSKQLECDLKLQANAIRNCPDAYERLKPMDCPELHSADLERPNSYAKGSRRIPQRGRGWQSAPGRWLAPVAVLGFSTLIFLLIRQPINEPTPQAVLETTQSQQEVVKLARETAALLDSVKLRIQTRRASQPRLGAKVDLIIEQRLAKDQDRLNTLLATE